MTTLYKAGLYSVHYHDKNLRNPSDRGTQLSLFP